MLTPRELLATYVRGENVSENRVVTSRFLEFFQPELST
jgi:hypothetical protein